MLRVVDNARRGIALECHYRKPDQLGIELADQSGDGLTHYAIAQDKIRDCHFLFLIHVAGE
jgi:hypothetical protein